MWDGQGHALHACGSRELWLRAHPSRDALRKAGVLVTRILAC